ncbi:Resolvase domain protein, partial [human gut metagenome]
HHLSSLAQEESRNISENIRWGVVRKFEKGKVIVNCTKFMGYTKNEDGDLVIVPEEAEIVKLIFRLYLEGYSTKSEPVVEMAEQELSHNVSRHGAGDHQRADGRTIAEVYTDRTEMRAVRTGKRRKKSRKDQKPESALPLGAGGRNAVERTALSGERFIVLGTVRPA